MKRLKKLLSTIIASTVAISCIGNIVFAATTDFDTATSGNVYTEDFTDGEVKWIDSGNTAENMQYEIITDEATGNKYMKVLSTSTGNNSLGIWFNTVSEGKIRVKFDYMTNDISSDKKSWVTLERQYITRPANDYISVLGALQGKYCVFTDNSTDKVLSTIEAGEWYTQEVIIDLDTHEGAAILYKKGNDTPEGSYAKVLETTQWSYFEWPNTITAFDHLRFRNSVDCYVDNISIDKLNKDNVIFVEDYEEVPYHSIVNGTGSVINDNDNSYLHMNMTSVTDWSVNKFVYNIPTLSKGNKYQIKFDYMTNLTSGSAYVVLANRSNHNTDEYLSILGASGGKLSVFGYAYPTPISITAGQWYTQYITVDMDTHKVEAAVYEKGSSTPLGTMFRTLSSTDEYSLYQWPANVEEFNLLMHYGGNDGYIDNIEIKKLEKDDPNLIFSENYEDSITPIKSGSGELITDESGNTYLKFANAWNANALSYEIPTISTGKISVEFDYKKPNKTEQTYVVLGNGAVNEYKEWLKLFHVSGGQYGGALTSFMYDDPHLLGRWSSADVWYTQKVIIDMDNHNVSATLYKKGEETPIGTVSDTLESTNNNFSGWPATSNEFTRFICFGDALDGSDGYACIDNIKIGHIYESPALDSESVTIKVDNENIQEIWTEVNPSAKIIDLDFGTTMDEDTINGDYIYVTKKDAEDKISSKITYANGVATITATDNWEPGSYTIHVSADVANQAGVTLGDDFMVDFTVVVGNVSATIIGVFTGENLENMVYEYSELKAGDELTLSVMFENATGSVSTAKLLVAYYNNEGSLINVSGSDISITADSFSNQNLTHTFKEFSKATSMKFFVWEDYSTISPLGESYSI